LVDVRSFTAHASIRFNREALEISLREAQIDYVHIKSWVA